MPSIYNINYGDTLSGIAGANKTNIAALLKLNPNIRDPNKIQAGEKLTMPETTVIPEMLPDTSGVGTTGSVKEMLTPGTARDVLEKKILETVSQPAAKSLETQYKELSTAKGIPGLESKAAGYDTEITKTLGLLSSLESDISKRTGDYLVSEASRNRILASEKKPLSDILRTLQAGEKQTESALTTAKADIKEQLAMAEKDQSMTGIKTQADLLKTLSDLENPKLNTTVRDIGGRQVLINTQTGKTIKDLGATSRALGTTNILTISEAVNNGLPISMVGMTEEEVAKDLSSDTVPKWFRSKIEDEQQMSMTAGSLKTMWADFRKNFVSAKGTVTKPTTAGAIVNPFSKP